MNSVDPNQLHREKTRLNTFWWTWSFNNRRQLTKARFFAYDDIGNIQCFECSVTLNWWTTDVNSQHAIRAPHCIFINGLRTKNVPIPTPQFHDILTEDDTFETYDFMDSLQTFPVITSPSLFTIPTSVNNHTVDSLFLYTQCLAVSGLDSIRSLIGQ